MSFSQMLIFRLQYILYHNDPIFTQFISCHVGYIVSSPD